MAKIPIKSAEEIEIMREAACIAATALQAVVDSAKPGISTYELDQVGKEAIEHFGAVSACHNYRAGNLRFPGYTCISVNDEVVHGIGTLKRILAEGDLVSIDVSVVYKGYVGDNATTIIIGETDEVNEQLVHTAREALLKGIAQAKSGNRVGDISSSIQKFVEAQGFSVVREFVGHGVGKSMHEEPQIPNFGHPKQGARLLAGMTLAIEPMVNLGTPGVEYGSDGWTVLTKDRKPSAHFEHTVLITDKGPEILTIPQK